MKWTEIIKTHDIRVFDPSGRFTETTFRNTAAGIEADNKEMGGPFLHPKYKDHPEAFNKHINRMINEGFSIDLKCNLKLI